MNYIKSFNKYKKVIYYPLEEEDIERGFLYYKRSRKFKLKLLHTSLKKLRIFLRKEKQLDFKYYTKLSTNNFIIDDTIINREGEIAVKLPFYFQINKIYKL